MNPQQLDSLAKYICDKPTIESRRDFLAGWEKNHGDESAKLLRQAVAAEWMDRKGVER